MLCLIRFHQKAYKRKNNGRRGGSKEITITNNGEIIFTYAEAKELGLKSTQTFYRVLRELIEDKGFIDVAESGNWYFREPTKFSISARWKKYGTPEYEPIVLPRSLPAGKGFPKNRFDEKK